MPISSGEKPSTSEPMAATTALRDRMTKSEVNSMDVDLCQKEFTGVSEEAPGICQTRRTTAAHERTGHKELSPDAV